MTIKLQQRGERLWFVEQHGDCEVRTLGTIEASPHGFGLDVEAVDYVVDVCGTRKHLHNVEFADAVQAACEIAT